ncbi:zinc finger C2HC domain-containing protein 1C [Bombina bombina]|uniref:zinc finger C2HC domain-containing protein 1C n=1 Tax=Bombina bombina TaxID=8345 RepID=UPI00235A7142|nr:zinc finger C2HC domain-containing protein 1C [Bombina bombina]XP_053544986.1 zinc finger C2HC domain-containing protein 1C [Bombina bombina]
MARLHMAPNPYREGLGEAKLPSLRQDIQAPKIMSRLEQLRYEYQDRVLKQKDEKMLTLLAREQENTPKRVTSFTLGTVPNHSDALKHPERKQHLSQNQYPASRPSIWESEDKKWASNWTVAKKSFGVDRAYPLKPVSHRKFPENMTLGVSNHHRSPSANSSGVKPLLPEYVRSKSGPSRTDPWQQLQEREYSLEAEIRKKEKLLREKLRRTEEELRRIQREKELAELEEKRLNEIQEGRKRVTKTQKKAEKSYPYMYSTDEGEDKKRSYRSHAESRPYQVEESSLPTGTPSPPPADLLYRTGRLKREHKVTSHTTNIARTQSISPKYEEDQGPLLSLRTPPALADENHTVDSDGDEERFPVVTAPDGLDVKLVPCGICGRRFAQQRLEKHMEACRKLQNSKRKVFDSSLARAKGTDLEQFLQTKGRAPPPATQVQKRTWRQKHESFMRTIQQAREVQHVIAKGGKLSDLPPPPPEENPDYVPCPHCNRRFAPRAAERHIPKCETIKSKPRPPPQQRR